MAATVSGLGYLGYNSDVLDGWEIAVGVLLTFLPLLATFFTGTLPAGLCVLLSLLDRMMEEAGTGLQSLNLSYCRTLTNVNGLRGLKNLEKLDL